MIVGRKGILYDNLFIDFLLKIGSDEKISLKFILDWISVFIFIDSIVEYLLCLVNHQSIPLLNG